MTMQTTEQPMPKLVHAADKECGSGQGAQGPWLGYRPPTSSDGCARGVLASTLGRVMRMLAPGTEK